jgi:hypothetical protein
VEDVRSVLEGSSELIGVHGHLHDNIGGNVGKHVIVDWRVSSVVLPVNEVGGRVVSIELGSVLCVVNIGGGNVVSQSENTVAVVVINARLLRSSWKSPVVVGVVSSNGVSKVIISLPRSLNAIRSRVFIIFGGWSRNFGPVDFINTEGIATIFSDRRKEFSGGLVSANATGGNVSGVLGVEIAVGIVVNENGNIDPWRRSPVWVVISFFRAFVTVSVTVVVLSGEDGGSSVLVKVSFLFTIGYPESVVSFSGLAVLVIVVVLVHSKSKVVVGIGVSLSWSLWIIRDGVGRRTVSDEQSVGSVGLGAHVLNNHVAIQFGVAATVLRSPFDHEERTFVEAHGRSVAISSLGVILRVEKTICIVSVVVCFVQSVIRTSRVLHVQIGESASRE